MDAASGHSSRPRCPTRRPRVGNTSSASRGVARPPTAALLLGSLLLVGIACAPELSEDSWRVAVISFQHETCTFCPGGDVTVEDWTRLAPPAGGDELLNSGSYVRGFRDQARAFGDIELVPEVDGVYLALHGAMAVRDVPRPEAEIARRFREAVGPDVPIAGTFDLHGNEDAEFLDWADFAFVTKRYPHYDAYLQGERAARGLREAMRGAYRPTTATRKPGVITPTVLQWTGAAPSMLIMERARRWEARESGVYVSVFYGYPWSDVPDVGATVHVMTNGDQELADRIADDMNDFIWRVREDFAVGRLPMPDSAAKLVRAAVRAGETPVAVGDHSDRPGDATHILRAFRANGIGNTLYGAITSPVTLRVLEESAAAPGDAFQGEIGGYTPSGGEPYPIQGTVEYFGEWQGYDRVAVVSIDNGDVVVLTPAYTQVTSPDTFRELGLDPADFEVFVVKSRVHFRRGFDETGFAPTIVVVEAPGPFVGTTFLDALPYQNVDLSTLFPYGTPPDRE